MAHDIAQIAGKDAVAYLGETPWHRLGTPMTGRPTVADALEAASLNWNVELQPMYLKRNGKIGKRIPKRFAVVRDVDSEVLGTVGTSYTPVQNSEAFGVLDAACKNHGVIIETAGALGKGDKVWMLAKLPEGIEPVPGDKIDGYFLVHSGHNGYTPTTGRPTPVRVVCANTLATAIRGSEEVVRLTHIKTEADQLEAVSRLIESMIEGLKSSGETFAALAAKKLSLKAIDSYVDSVLGFDHDFAQGPALRTWQSIRGLVDTGKGAYLAPSTAWAAYNGVTEHLDHVRLGNKSAKSLVSADKSALFGPLAKVRRTALELAIAL